MSKIARKIALGVLSALSVICLVVGGVNVTSMTANAVTQDNEFTNNGQFVVGNYSGDAVNFPYEIIDGATQNLPAGCTGSVVKIGSKINGGAAYINIDFTASKISAAKVESVIARVYSPDYTADDQLRINNISGSVTAADLSNWCDVALPIATITGSDGNLGSFAFGLRDKGTVSDYFYIDEITVKMKESVETTPVTFTHINASWNDNTETLNNGIHYTVIHLSGLLTSGYLGVDDNWSDMMANSTINGGASYFNFSPASYFAGPNVASDFIILFTAQAPAQGDEFIVRAGATFDVGGDDNRLYELTNDICLKYNGTAWEVFEPNTQQPVEPDNVQVTFTNINTTFNNNTTVVAGMYYTVLHLDGVQTSGYFTQGDDWTQMVANVTGVTYFGFAPASIIAGPNVANASYIILYSATAPTEGDEFSVKAGATFKVGGNDTNVYELVNDICLRFNGTVWEIYDSNTQPPVEPPTVEPAEPVLVEFTGVNSTWNNFDYTDVGYFCTFLHFEGGISGGALDGDFSDLLSKMTLNGQPVDTENVSLICAAWIGANSGFILRFKTLPAEKSVLVLPEGATFTVGGGDTNVYKITESVELKLLNGKWSVPAPMAAFIGVNAWNNNIFSLAGTRFTLLDFNVPNLGNVVNGNKNLVAMAGVSINGVKLTDIEGASINYANGENHMAIDLPATAIYPTEEYPITILKVEEGTMFENYSLPEITLSLIGGTWVVGELETMPKVDNYVTVSDIMGVDRYEMGAEGSISAATGFEGNVHFKVVYRTEEAIVNYAPSGGLTVYLNSTNLWDGWRIFFVANKVYVYDATMGGVGDEHVLIGEADFGIANGIEMQLEISVTQTNGKYSIVIGGSCAKILEINDITPIGNCIGGGIMFYSSARGCSVKDYKYGDIFDPVLTIHSKQEIVLNEGDAVPEIFAEAKDGFTAITPTYTWDEGAITDGKMNAGIWQCEVVATDANGNYTMQIIRVTVKGEREYRVTFDGKDEAVYAYGEKIEKPADPTKASTEKYAYTFDGWYFGEDKWDFEHDIVTSDVALVAKFIQSDVLYKVTFTIAGEETQVLYVTFGAQVDLAIFDKEGLDKEVKQDGKAIEILIVTADTTIEISYHEKNKTQRIGCFGGLIGGGSVLALLGAAGGLVIRKRREDDEE